MVRRDALLVLDLRLYVLDQVAAQDIQCEVLAREGLSLREPGLISDPKVNFSYFEIAMGRYGEVWARRNVYSAPPRYYKCTATHATPI